MSEDALACLLRVLCVWSCVQRNLWRIRPFVPYLSHSTIANTIIAHFQTLMFSSDRETLLIVRAHAGFPSRVKIAPPPRRQHQQAPVCPLIPGFVLNPPKDRGCPLWDRWRRRTSVTVSQEKAPFREPNLVIIWNRSKVYVPLKLIQVNRSKAISAVTMC